MGIEATVKNALGDLRFLVTNNRTIKNEKEIRGHIATIEAELAKFPKEFQEAFAVLSRRDEIINAALGEAESIRATARHLGEEDAARIIEAASQDASRILSIAQGKEEAAKRDSEIYEGRVTAAHEELAKAQQGLRRIAETANAVRNLIRTGVALEIADAIPQDTKSPRPVAPL